MKNVKSNFWSKTEKSNLISFIDSYMDNGKVVTDNVTKKLIPNLRGKFTFKTIMKGTSIAVPKSIGGWRINDALGEVLRDLKKA